MRVFPLSMALLALAMPGGAARAGDQFSYNQLDVSGGFGLLIGDDIYAGLGWRLAGSVEITPHLFAFGNLHKARYYEQHVDDTFGEISWNLSEDDDVEYRDDDSEHIDKRGHEYGLGLNLPLVHKLDLVAGVSRMYQHLERDGDDDYPLRIRNERIRGHGPSLQVGVRGLVGEALAYRVALNVAVLHTDFDRFGPYGDPESGRKYRGLEGLTWSIRLQPLKRLAFGFDIAAVQFARDTDLRIQLGVRMQFDDWDGPPD
jgi:hypothetical protein